MEWRQFYPTLAAWGNSSRRLQSCFILGLMKRKRTMIATLYVVGKILLKQETNIFNKFSWLLNTNYLLLMTKCSKHINIEQAFGAFTDVTLVSHYPDIFSKKDQFVNINIIMIVNNVGTVIFLKSWHKCITIWIVWTDAKALPGSSSKSKSRPISMRCSGVDTERASTSPIASWNPEHRKSFG